MQEDKTCQSQYGVFVVLPEEGDSDFPPRLPLVVTKQPESSAEAGFPASPPFSYASSPLSSTSSKGRSLGHDQRDAFYANILRSHQIKVTSSFSLLDIANIRWQLTSPSSRQQKVRTWHDALLRKRELVIEILQAQKAIEEVENEVAQYLTKDTIARMHQKYYNLNGGDTLDGMFISAISALRVMG